MHIHAHRIIKLLLLICILLCAAGVAYAVEPYKPLTPLPQVTQNQATLVQYLNALFRLGIGLAAFIGVIRLVIAGVKYMGESVTGKGSAKEDIREVIGGLLLILATVLILQTINGDILNLNILKGQPSVGPIDVPQIPLTGNTSGLTQQEGEAWLEKAAELCKAEGGTLRKRSTGFSGIAYKCDKSTPPSGN